MELFGVRLVGFNADTLAKLFLTAIIVVAALVFRALTSRQYTGRVVTFTNSEVFEQATFNYSRMFGFLWEEMRLPLHFDEDVERAEAIALAAAREATDDDVVEARRQLERMRQQYPLQPAELEPQSYLRITDNWVELSIRFLVRAWGVRAAKDGITRAILARYRAEGISIASATFELVKAPELSIRPVERRAAPPADAHPAQPWDER